MSKARPSSPPAPLARREPSPLAGEGREGGTSLSPKVGSPPSPPLPRKGGERRPALAALFCRNVSRLSEARLHAVSSRNMYSEHGFDARISPEAGQVCQSLTVV